MKKIFSLLFLVFIFFQGFSSNYVDSLENLQNHPVKDSLFYEKMYSYLKKTFRVYPDTSLYYMDKYLKKTEDTTKFRGVGLCYLIKGLMLKQMGRYEEALEANKIALKYIKPINYKVAESAIYNNTGITYKNMRDYKNALKYLTKSLELKKEIGNPVKLIPTRNNIGLVYYHLQEYKMAEKYHLENIQAAKKYNLPVRLSKYYNNLGNVKIRQQKHVLALRYYLKADSSLEEGKDRYLRATILGNIAISYENLDLYNKARNYYDRALSLATEINDINTKVLALRGMQRVLYELNDTTRSKYYLDSVWNLCKENNDYWTLAAISNELTERYKKEGNYKLGLYYMDKYHEYYDSSHNIEKTKEIHRLKEKFESKQKAQRIDLLEKENKLQEEAKEKRILQIVILIIIVFFALIASLYFWRRNKVRKRINQQLTEQNQLILEQQEEIKIQNENLSKANQLKDKMFQIISHDLKSPLIALDDVARIIPYCIEDEDYETLRKSSQTLNTSVSRVLGLIDNLLAWAMNQGGNIPYNPEKLRINEVVNEVMDVYHNQAEKKDIAFQNNIDSDYLVFADKNLLMTVLRNLINNAIKFTYENGNIELEAEEDEDYLRISVEDDGIGMDKERLENIFSLEKDKSIGTHGEPGNGLGMFFTKEFVSINKGEISVESEKGKGTKISFTLPLAKSYVQA
jgi:signal transduction histidine kinase